MRYTNLRTCFINAAVIAATLGFSAPLWASAFTVQTDLRASSEAAYVPLPSLASSPTYQLAMMDDMNEMGGMGGMGSAKKDDTMKNMKKMPANKGSMSSMPPSSNMQDPMATPSNMDMMGRMRGSRQGMRNMAPNMGGSMPSSNLPGFPGASHLYHIGSTGFFLDHPEHITLTASQQSTLNKIKEKALLERASADRRIEEAEQELWTLTSADAPDAAKIEAKVKDIETLRSDQRLAYIRAVGDAAKVLTSDQHASLLGTKPPAGKPAPVGKQPAASKQPAPAKQPATSKPSAATAHPPADQPAADQPAAPMPGMSAPMSDH